MKSVKSFSKEALNSFASTIQIIPTDTGAVGKIYKLVRQQTGTYFIIHKQSGTIETGEICSYRAGLAIMLRLESQTRLSLISTILTDDQRLERALVDMKRFKMKALAELGNQSDIFFSRYQEAKNTARIYSDRLARYVPPSIFRT